MADEVAEDADGIRRREPSNQLMHTAASVLLAHGATLKDVQETLGHANFALTADVYAHLLEESRRDVAER